MILKSQRRIAAQLLNIGENRVWFDESRMQEIKEAITKSDIRSLIRDKAVQARPYLSQSRTRARKKLIQKRKGRQKGKGGRKGKKTARLSSKKNWMLKVRSQRKLLRLLKEKKMLESNVYREMYRKTKGGFFRSRRHIKIYLQDHNLVREQNDKSTKKKGTGKNRLQT